MESVILLDIDRAEYDQTAGSYIQEAYGELPDTKVELVTDVEEFYRLYYISDKDMELPRTSIYHNAWISVVSSQYDMDIQGAAVAPDWLMIIASEVLGNTRGKADTLDIPNVRSSLAYYLTDIAPNADSAIANSNIIRPFRHNRSVCFSFRHFAYTLDIRSTQQMSKLANLLEIWGLKTRCSMTLRVDGQRKVMKLARMETSNPKCRQLLIEVANMRKAQDDDIVERVKRSLL